MKPFARWVKQEATMIARMLSEVPPEVVSGPSPERAFEEVVMGLGSGARRSNKGTAAAAASTGGAASASFSMPGQ